MREAFFGEPEGRNLVRSELLTVEGHFADGSPAINSPSSVRDLHPGAVGIDVHDGGKRSGGGGAAIGIDGFEDEESVLILIGGGNRSGNVLLPLFLGQLLYSIDALTGLGHDFRGGDGFKQLLISIVGLLQFSRCFVESSAIKLDLRVFGLKFPEFLQAHGGRSIVLTIEGLRDLIEKLLH